MLSVHDSIQTLSSSLAKHAVTLPLYVTHQYDQVVGPILCHGFLAGMICQFGQYYLGKLGAPLMVACMLLAGDPDAPPEHMPMPTMLKRIQTAVIGAGLYAGLLAINPYAWMYGSTLLTTMLATAIISYPTYFSEPSRQQPIKYTYQQFAALPETTAQVYAMQAKISRFTLRLFQVLHHSCWQTSMRVRNGYGSCVMRIPAIALLDPHVRAIGQRLKDLARTISQPNA